MIKKMSKHFLGETTLKQHLKKAPLASLCDSPHDLRIPVNTRRYLDVDSTFFERFPVNTRRYLDANSTFFERYRRQMDVVC